MQLDKDTRSEIRQLLIPHVQNAADRDALVREAFYGSGLINQISGDGKDAVAYASHVLDECMKFGNVSQSEHALVALLNELRLYIGYDGQQQIDSIKMRLLYTDTQPQTVGLPSEAEGLAAEDYFAMGEIRRLNGNWHAAIDMYGRAIEVRSDYSPAYRMRAYVYGTMLGQLQSALADRDTVVKLNPNFSGNYNDRGYVYYKLGMYDEAIADYDEALRLDPNNNVAQINREHAIKARDGQ